MNTELFEQGVALTFDDVLVVPGYSHVLPSDTDVSVQLTEKIRLNVPILSAAMDTVTEARLAIALARQGGIGVIHRNLSPEDQAAEVDKVKRSQSGMIVDPITLKPDATIQEAEDIMSHYHISGIPIVEDGDVLVGILTNRDIRFLNAENYRSPVREYMTSEKLVTGPVGIDMNGAKSLLQKYRIEKLPLVDEQGVLKGLITVKDIQKERDFPLAATDERGRLMVGAAVGVRDGSDKRLEGLLAMDVDLIAVDTAHGHTRDVIEAVKRIRKVAPDLALIAGNVVTPEGTRALIEAGVDVVKVGVGAGSICTTRVVAGVGMPQLSAIHACARAAKAHGVPIVADGGIKFSGDIVKAIAAGANAVMLGNLLAGLEESPGETVLFEGRQFKDYRGMGSMGAMKGYGRDRYGSGIVASGKTVPEGIEGRVPYKGPLEEYVYQLVGGLRSGMGYAGAENLEELQQNARLIRITNAGLIESHPHDVVITKEAPNYQVM
ncbi:MAG: IMP dehydrogenase [Anaerolineales bacterium]|jgi:IMP dehydrogenase